MLRTYIAELDRLVCEHISLSEGIVTKYDLYEYASATIVHLEHNGYTVASDIQLAGLLEALDAFGADDTVDESLRDWARRARSAISGAVDRIIPKAAHAKLAKYHDKKLNKAVDAGDDREALSRYIKKARAIKLANPEKWDFTNSGRVSDPEHHSNVKTVGSYGSPADARRMLRSVKAARTDRAAKLADRPAQHLRKQAAKDSAIRAAATTHPGVPQFPPDSDKTSPGRVRTKAPMPLSARPGIHPPANTQVTLSKKVNPPTAMTYQPSNLGATASGDTKTNPGIRRRRPQ